MSQADAAVLFRTEDTADGRKIGIATLNSERSLNALSLAMIDALEPQLHAWAADDCIACVWLEGAGAKAFCAGGDIVAMYKAAQAMPSEPVAEVVDFFTREYRLDYLIRTYAKPLVVWGDGFVMGGGIGLMNGASHRVVTERSRLAMPEISIGLYPDVGGTYFLSRMPEGMGLFLGLTAAQVNAKDALWLGMADFALQSDQKDSALEALRGIEWAADAGTNKALADKALNALATLAQGLPEAQLQPQHETIRSLMQGESILDVADQFLAFESDDKAITRGQTTLQAGCPLTAHIVWQQLTHGQTLTLEEAFQLELTLSVNCAIHGDFIEGVRALLIDKDKNPKWQHASIAEVSESDLDRVFAAPWAADEHPLRDLGKPLS
ncbi:MAG: enoyl-CoA hydratase/isomerase family protein [Idiomarina sp.]|nr:enoyl-CoA hydratase/isomerase family protein [Idiomarina sp.]